MVKTTGKKNPSSFYIYTLGCKTNQSESDGISRELSVRGLKPASPGVTPDVIIINTCTVTAAADKKARQSIRRLKRRFPDSVFLVTGCFTVFNKGFLKKNGIGYIVENNMKSEIPGILGLQNRLAKNHTAPGHSRALLKIQDGCEQKCSYCIVPFVRGNYWSKPYRDIIDEVIRFEEEGHDEIVLTGIHIGKYGVDLSRVTGETGNLAGLVSKILEDTSIKRIRLSSLEINELTSDIIDLMSAGKGRIARHLHIPLQSGSDTVMKKMNRPYNRQYFLEKIKKVKKAIPDIVLTTDVIVGFPGETGEDFSQTINIIEDIFFSKIHVFKYSVRENTSSFLMDGRIDEKEINSRSEKVRKLGNDLRMKFIGTLAGRLLGPVCEEYDARNGMVHGISEQYVRVYAELEYDSFVKKRGRIIKVLAKNPYLDGINGTVL